MVRLQKHKAYVYESESGEKIEHYKHLVNIPEDAIEKLGWEEGVELESIVQAEKLILKPTEQDKSSRVRDTTHPKVALKRRSEDEE